MRRLLAALSLVLLPALVPADEKKKEEKPAANTLTKEEAQKGWLLLFDGETTFGWKIDGEAKVEDGALVLGGKKKTTAEPTARFRLELIEFVPRMEGDERPAIVGRGWDVMVGGKEKVRGGKTSMGPIDPGDGPLFRITVPAGSKLYLRDVKGLPALETKLFDGKSLDGWKAYKGDKKREKSKFSVTKDGWLNVKDGPGDLQTEKKYDDFVLQLECISNGKHLNSGIFFRSLPGEYQQGYEAQIRNEFKDTASQKYVVEEYDAKTNKLTGKKEVMSPAVDYGTGAIYRRVPARKQVAKDGEWFTMTVVARGRHLATWVNGVQQVDWTDNRPEGKNARVGYYGDAGCISIQGHDPTTDLSFRNIRISTLPRPK